MCRFFYPRNLHDEAVVTKDLNPNRKSQWDFFDADRNDHRVNNYMPGVLLGWGANVDCTPCTSLDAVVNYIAKYVAKHETKTKPYDELANELVTQVSSEKFMVSFHAKLINKLFAERDWPAMEVAHNLLGYPLVETSHEIISVNMKPPSGGDRVLVGGENNRMRRCLTPWEKYCGRDARWSCLTFFQFLSMIDYSKKVWSWRTNRAKPRVLNYFPRFNSDQKDAAKFEHFARIKLTLQHPHRSLDDLKTADGEQFTTFAEAYLHCRRVHVGERAHVDDDYYGKDLPEVEDGFEHVEPDPEEGDRPDWGLLAGQINGDGGGVDDLPLLGNREVDAIYDWSRHVGLHAEISQMRDFWKLKKAQFPIGEADALARSRSWFGMLNDEQRLLYDTVVDHWKAALARGRLYYGYDGKRTAENQLLLQVDGRGGTGKSFALEIMVAELRRLALGAGIEASGIVLIAAPTGVAANAIGGQTLHSLLRLPITPAKEMPLLSVEEATNLRRQIQAVEFLFIDEKSMIGCVALYRIDRRLRQILEQPDLPFGGRNVILMGDFAQLPPVKASALYKPANLLRRGEETGGRASYLAFNKTITLKKLVRQGDADQAPFREALDALRDNNATSETWELLATRIYSKLPLPEIQRFDKAVRIYPTNGQVVEYNRTHLEGLDAAVINIQATNSGQGADSVASRDAGNLHNNIPLCIGARVMLMENIWTEAGLVNGAVGRIYDIAWSPETIDPRKEPPSLLLVRMDRYSGPRCFDDETIPSNVVPVFTSLRDFTKGKAACSRRQFPVTVAYAITIHKSQGATLPLVALDIVSKIKTSGLIYVAISRATRLDGIMFESSFQLRDLRIENDQVGEWRAADLRRRRNAGQLLNE